jgi:hypothetical protein
VSQPTQKPVGDDQLYLQVTFRYYDVYLGLLSVFNQSSDTVSCQLQWTDVLSVHTTFERVEAGTALIPCEDDYCRGMCHPAAFPAQPADGGDISMYYWGTVGQHNIGVQHGFFNLATLRGFAGMRSSDAAAADEDAPKPGVLRSRPLPCSAAKLIVSADANIGASSATVCVGLFGIAGLGVADCVPVALEAGGGGVTDHVVEWRGGKTLGALVGRKLVLEFVLTNATLWTFGFDARGNADAVPPSLKAKTDDDSQQRPVTNAAVDTEDRHEGPPLLGAAVLIWHRDGTAADLHTHNASIVDSTLSRIGGTCEQLLRLGVTTDDTRLKKRLKTVKSDDWLPFSVQPSPILPVLERTTVFSSGEASVRCFRIPAVVETAPGHLLAFAEARWGTCQGCRVAAPQGPQLAPVGTMNMNALCLGDLIYVRKGWNMADSCSIHPSPPMYHSWPLCVAPGARCNVSDECRKAIALKRSTDGAGLRGSYNIIYLTPFLFL